MDFSVSRPRRQGFTLIELLVVVAIIALLAAILFPVFGRARENARRSSCQSNLKQIGLGILQYTQDYDEFYPCGLNYAPSTNNPGHGWAGQINSYVKSYQVFRCPSDTVGRSNTASNLFPLSYAYNALMARNNVKSHASLNASSLTVMLFEVQPQNSGNALVDVSQPDEDCPTDFGTAPCAASGQSHSPSGNGVTASGPANGFTVSGNGLSFYDYATGQISNGGTLRTKEGRHFEGASYLAADGHVKWLKGIQISGGNTAGAPSCPEDGSGAICAPGQAAGTSNITQNGTGAPYQLTFSPT